MSHRISKYFTKALALMTALTAALFGAQCAGKNEPGDYRREMRDFVINISKEARSVKKDFIVIPQNGIQLITDDGETDGKLAEDYLAAIDGHGQEELFFGYDGADDVATPQDITAELLPFLRLSKGHGKTILLTDYCSKAKNFLSSYEQAVKEGFIEQVAFSRELDSFPPGHPYLENNSDIAKLSEVQNFLYLINSHKYSRVEFLAALAATNFDLIIIDLFDRDGVAFTKDDIAILKTKADGGKRLVIAYMSIGEAEDYRYYWDESWKEEPPSWLEKENSAWAGNYKVRYWDRAWQKIIFKGEGSYLSRIMAAGFDGVYLDIIDAFEYFE